MVELVEALEQDAPSAEPPEIRRVWPRLERLSICALVVFAIVFLARTPWSYGGGRHYSLFDDAMISMRYARNLARGYGFGWNRTGPRVEGYSNTLWTLWMVVLHLLPLPTAKVSLAVSLSGLLVLIGNALVARQIAIRLAPTQRWVGAAAMWLTVTYYPLDYWTLRGMEVGLAALLLSAGALLAIRVVERPEQAPLLAVPLCLAVLCRDDGLVGCLIIIAWLAWQLRAQVRIRVCGLLCTAVASTVAAHAVFRRVYYHSWLPNTYYLKLGHISLRTRVHRGLFGLLAFGELELALLVVLAAVLLIGWRRSVPSGVWLLAGIFAAQCFYSVFVGGDAWELLQLSNRYVASGATAILVLAAVAVARITADERGPRWLAGGAIALVPVLVLRVKDTIPAAGLQLGRLPREPFLTRVGIPLIAILGLLLASIVLMRSVPRSTAGASRVRGRVAAGLIVLVMLVTGTREFVDWVHHNAFIGSDNQTAKIGLLLREFADQRATVGVFAAGGSAYFSDREAVDFGGKSDSHVAHEAPSIPKFIPGHDKLDLAYSVGVLRPDVVVGPLSGVYRASVVKFGYVQYGQLFYVRPDSPYVNRDVLTRLAGT